MRLLGGGHPFPVDCFAPPIAAHPQEDNRDRQQQRNTGGEVQQAGLHGIMLPRGWAEPMSARLSLSKSAFRAAIGRGAEVVAAGRAEVVRFPLASAAMTCERDEGQRERRQEEEPIGGGDLDLVRSRDQHHGQTASAAMWNPAFWFDQTAYRRPFLPAKVLVAWVHRLECAGTTFGHEEKLGSDHELAVCLCSCVDVNQYRSMRS